MACAEFPIQRIAIRATRISERWKVSSRWTEQDLARLSQRNGPLRQSQPSAVVKAQSKYHNVQTVADGVKFDSKREAEYWMLLRLRERAGEIRNLERQIKIPLVCPCKDGTEAVVAHYVADFTYTDKAGEHVVDAKGKRTRMYDLKKKWLFLQGGIEIEEV